MMSWFVSLVTNWISNSWRLIKGAFSLLGQLEMDDDDFFRMAWPGTYQRETSDRENRLDADCVSQGPFDSKYY